MTDPRKPIFDAARTAKGSGFTQAHVDAINAALDQAGVPREVVPGQRTVSPKGIALMHKLEGSKLVAYPDPGSKDGNPWTIGRGATGPGITKGTVWTQAQADARFEQDLISYAAAVSKFIGDTPTTQAQFDALVSFHYNTGAIASSTLGKKHRAGDYAGAAAEFPKWIYNDGKPMEGLKNRRADERKLYEGRWA